MARRLLLLACCIALCCFKASAQSENERREALDDAMRNQTTQMAGPTEGEKPSTEKNSGQTIAIEIGIFAILAILFRNYVGTLGSFLTRRLDRTGPATQLDDSQAYGDFISTFQATLENRIADSLIAAEQRDAAAIQRFFEAAPGRIAAIKTLFAKVSSASDPPSRQKVLEELCELTRQMRVVSESPQLRAVLQLTTGVDGLLRQLAEKPSNVTASAVRTVGGGIVLLEKVAVPGLKQDIATNPPARFLIVDDDMISRRAVAMSLKKTFNAPDIAENGEAALPLAAANRYDVIFLDVEMPGMDGFEVCSKIREAGINQHTPIVFVTSHSDFDSRTKSTMVGGHDLVAKPFLPFEITVKALTLLVRGRLLPSPAAAAQPDRNEQSVPSHTPASTSNDAFTHSAEKPTAPPTRATVPSTPAVQPAATLRDDGPVSSNGQTSSGVTVTEFASAFLSNAPEHLGHLRELLTAARETLAAGAPGEALTEFYLGIHMFVRDAERAKFNAASTVGSAIERFIKRLLAKPALSESSGLDNVVAAMDVIEKLCASSAGSDLNLSSPRILAVDDDPIARRAIASAVQLTFDKPDTVDSGESAVAFASAKAYDLIFMDVRMPGMDGFDACEKIRQAPLNAITPIIFVTSQHDTQSREQATLRGGNGFIPKPVLHAEIALVAATFIFQGRLHQRTSHEARHACPQPAATLVEPALS